MRARHRPAIQPLFDVLERTRTQWPTGGWSWDTRFTCAASSFAADYAKEARAAAALSLPNVWTEVTLRKAPDEVQQVAEQTGGVGQGQLLLASAVVDGVFAYGLWWPWRNGVNISMRIGLAGDVEEQDHMAFRELLRAEL